MPKAKEPPALLPGPRRCPPRTVISSSQRVEGVIVGCPTLKLLRRRCKHAATCLRITALIRYAQSLPPPSWPYRGFAPRTFSHILRNRARGPQCQEGPTTYTLDPFLPISSRRYPLLLSRFQVEITLSRPHKTPDPQARCTQAEVKGKIGKYFQPSLRAMAVEKTSEAIK